MIGGGGGERERMRGGEENIYSVNVIVEMKLTMSLSYSPCSVI